MHNVGFCWLSRSINSIQRLIDVATYNQEKLGSRPLRQLILGKGIGADMIKDAIQAAEEVMDNRGLRRTLRNTKLGQRLLRYCRERARHRSATARQETRRHRPDGTDRPAGIKGFQHTRTPQICRHTRLPGAVHLMQGKGKGH